MPSPGWGSWPGWGGTGGGSLRLRMRTAPCLSLAGFQFWGQYSPFACKAWTPSLAVTWVEGGTEGVEREEAPGGGGVGTNVRRRTSDRTSTVRGRSWPGSCRLWLMLAHLVAQFAMVPAQPWTNTERPLPQLPSLQAQEGRGGMTRVSACGTRPCYRKSRRPQLPSLLCALTLPAFFRMPWVSTRRGQTGSLTCVI